MRWMGYAMRMTQRTLPRGSENRPKRGKTKDKKDWKRNPAMAYQAWSVTT